MHDVLIRHMLMLIELDVLKYNLQGAEHFFSQFFVYNTD